MPMSENTATYQDVRDILDQAMESERGVRVPCDSENYATHLVMRCNQFRKLDRRENKLTYPEGHIMHGKSPYDVLSISRVDSAVKIVKITPGRFTVEAL